MARTIRPTLDQHDQLVLVAKANNWLVKVCSPYSFYSVEFVRGAERVLIRTGKNGQLTSVHAVNGSGVIVNPRRGKFREACVLLSAKEENQHYIVSKAGDAIVFCKCNQGFSGRDAIVRARAHINDPNPDSTAALLQKVMA